MYQWQRHGWVGTAGPVGHPELWRRIYGLVLTYGSTLTFPRVPSRIGIEGNEEADRLAELGRPQHPRNATQVEKRRCLIEGGALWVGLGLEESSSGSELGSGREPMHASESDSPETPRLGSGRGVNKAWMRLMGRAVTWPLTQKAGGQWLLPARVTVK